MQRHTVVAVAAYDVVASVFVVAEQVCDVGAAT